MPSKQKIEIDSLALLVTMRDYYCSQKFDWLAIRLYDGYVTSCCKAEHDQLTLADLEKDPQGFFNWPQLIKERELMLDNQRVSGCEAACWRFEDLGLSSRRTQTQHQRYQGTRHLPRVLTIETSNTCNLTCVYCCKDFSSTWRRNIIDNGNYNVPGYQDRYNVTVTDQALHKSSQKLLDQTKIGKLIQNQIENNSDQVETLMLTGGEPLLYTGLESLLNRFTGKEIILYTGLGVPSSRLKHVLPLLEKHNVKVSISAENTNQHHEFNRYGYSYANFVYNVNMLRQHCKIQFGSVISNVTLFDFANFALLHADDDIMINYAHDPGFFLANLIDDHSRREITAKLEDIPQSFAQDIIAAMHIETVNDQRPALNNFLRKFAETRNLSLDIFPKNFLTWIEQSPNNQKIFPIRVNNETTLD